jgi:glycosyltransferase involved in cell wall biosynthesis
LISVIVLTYNEEANLAVCLNSLAQLSAEIFIVDSGSTDRTIEIANNFGCQIVSNPWKNHAEQMNWAIRELPIKTEWIMRLDADERLTPELAQELKEALPQSPSLVSAYEVKRRVFFMGRWIRYGGYYPTWLLRIWRTGLGFCEQRWMDEHIVISEGKIAQLQNDIIDDNKKDLTFWINKHNYYANREVQDILQIFSEKDVILATNNFTQVTQRRWIKKNLYSRSPLFLRALIYYLLRYFVGLGFLDGKEGLIFHFFQGFWYRFLVDAKIYEIQKKQLTPPSRI